MGAESPATVWQNPSVAKGDCISGGGVRPYGFRGVLHNKRRISKKLVGDALKKDKNYAIILTRGD